MESKPNVPATAAAAPTLKRRRTAGVKDEVAESTFAKDLQVNCGVLLGPMCGYYSIWVPADRRGASHAPDTLSEG